MKYLLDTNACIDLIRGRPAVVTRAESVSPDDCAVSSVTIFELFYGAEKARDPAVEREHVETLLATVIELPFGSRAAEAAAKIRQQLEFGGKVIGPFDLLLAGHALSAELIFVTDNVAEFSRVAGLSIENWRSQ